MSNLANLEKNIFENDKKKDFRVQDLSILAWIYENGIVTEKGDPLDFSDRLFLLDILNDWSQEIVIKKAAQVGGSVSFTLKTLYAVKYLGLNIMYTFPTDSDVQEFVGTKTNQIIKNNPTAFDGLNADNIERKTLGDRNIFYKGTVSKTAAIMTTADLLIHDEASRSDQAVIETMKSRLKASKFKGRWLFSNPTTEKDAIDLAWKQSDKKEWHIKCKKCDNPEQIISWPESVDANKKQFVCKFCREELTNNDRRAGRWIATDKGKKISGYHISLLMAPWISAEEVLKDSEGDQEYFYNFVLGEPYSPSDIRVNKGTILDNWTPKDLTTGNWFLGVDVGNIKHYALGSERGLVKVGRFSKWADLDEMIKTYKPTMVIDAMPDNTMSKYYVENYRNVLMSFFKENKDNPKTLVWWGENDKEGIVYSNRNRILDQLIDEILRANILFGLRNDSEIKLYLKHWETLRRVKIVDNKGIESYIWESTTGEDHYVFATLYYYLARLGSSFGTYIPEELRKAVPKEYNGSGDVESISENLCMANGWPIEE